MDFLDELTREDVEEMVQTAHNKQKKPLFIKAKLCQLDLSGINFRGADLSEVDFNGTDLSGANLNKANLRRAKGVPEK